MTSHTIQHHFTTDWYTHHVDPLFAQEQAFRFMRELRADPKNPELKHLPDMKVAVAAPTHSEPYFRVTFRFDGPLEGLQIYTIERALTGRENSHRPSIPANSSDH
jgi:hypothetical protein